MDLFMNFVVRKKHLTLARLENLTQSELSKGSKLPSYYPQVKGALPLYNPARSQASLDS